MDDGDIYEHMAVSPVGAGVQRLDVIASGVGRRRWTREGGVKLERNTADQLIERQRPALRRPRLGS
jgi:hypothetical protein